MVGVALLVVAPAVHAQDNAGTESPLMMGAGARALALGGAGVAMDTGSDALFWNPAHLATHERGDFSLFRTQLFVDGATYHAGFLTYPTVDLGTFALGYQRLGVDGIERRDDRNAWLGEFGSSESNLLLGYGRSLRSGVSVGGALRIVQQSVADHSGTGIGLDLGGRWSRNLDAAGSHWWTAGVNLQNVVEPQVRLDEEEVPDPTRARLGLAYHGAPAARRLDWSVTTELDLPRTAPLRLAMGAEVGLDRMFMVRVGLDHGRPTLGFGLEHSGVRLDYAMLAHDDLDRNDRLSLSVRFGLGVSERRQARIAAAEARVRDRLEQQLEARTQEAMAEARERAERALAAEKFEEAIRLFRQVLLYSPDDVAAQEGIDRARLRLALDEAAAELAAGEAARASASYQSILAEWAQQPEAVEGLARARAALQRAQDRDQQLNVLFTDALAHFSDGGFASAARLLNQLLELDPGHQLGRELLSRVHATRIAAGEEELQIARSLAGEGEYPRARLRLDVARKLLPERPELADLDATWAAEYQRIRREAAAAAERARQAAQSRNAAVTPSRPAPLSAAERERLLQLVREGLDGFQAGDFELAIRRWQTVWNERGDFEGVGQYLVKAYLYQGIHLYSQGQYDDALTRCQRVLEIEPGHEKALRYAARIQEERLEVEELGRTAR